MTYLFLYMSIVRNAGKLKCSLIPNLILLLPIGYHLLPLATIGYHLATIGYHLATINSQKAKRLAIIGLNAI